VTNFDGMFNSLKGAKTAHSSRAASTPDFMSGFRASVLVIGAVLVMIGCNTAPTDSDETALNVGFSRLATTAAPDSIYWTFSGSAGALSVTLSQTEYAITAQIPKKVSKDTLKFELRTLSITTYRVWTWAGNDVSAHEFNKTPGLIGNPLVARYDSLHKAAPALYPWTHSGIRASYVDVLVSGDSRFIGYPGNSPTGIDTTVLDSLILQKLVDTKDSVGKYSASWGINWTSDRIKAAYRKWIAKGLLRQGQFDTLFPYDDKPPTLVRPLAFTGVDDTTAIVRGTTGVNVLGVFADDSGIVGQTIKILLRSTGADVTQKFSINAADFPATPQKTWSLQGHLAIKTDYAPNGSYALVVSYHDRKSQVLNDTINFYVYPPGGVVIDTLPPTITPILPAVRRDTVLDTVQLYQVKIGIVDNVDIKTILLDEQPVALVNGAVTKNIRLIEGAEVMVTVQATDSSDNTSRDTIRVYRRKAVYPTVARMDSATGSVSVIDTVSTYDFRWKVDGVNIDSVTIGGVLVLLNDQKVADRVMPLSLGATTIVKIRVVDKLRHVTVDSIQVYRATSVPPLVVRKGVASGVITVPDSQSIFGASWTVSDNNLDQVLVAGASVALVGGVVSTSAYLKAGDTTRIVLQAKDKLGSVSADTLRVWRPDPRKPYLTDIAAVQRGDSVVPLTDSVLPNIRFGRFEVTADLYAKVMKTVRTTAVPGLPATNVNIYDAMLFCNALSKSAGLDTFYTYTSRDATTGFLAGYGVATDTNSGSVVRKGYRLPTAAEWDALAASWGGPYPWGSSVDTGVVDRYATWNTAGPTPVGTLQPTAHGVFDLAGNAGEWVYRNHGNTGVLSRWLVRGGDFSITTPAGLGSVDFWQDGTSRSATTGFRVIRVGQN